MKREVRAGDNLQAALDSALPGDEIVVQARASFVGNFSINTAVSRVKVRSSDEVVDRRVTLDDANSMPTVSSPTTEPALRGLYANGWTFEGIRFLSNAGGRGNVLEFDKAVDITVDRCLILGGQDGQKRAILANGRAITVTRNYVANIWAQGQDSQAFLAYDGAGPYTIRDNFFEAASENLMIGGADPSSALNVPADILIEANTFTKPREWVGTGKAMKNLLELKCAKRVTVRGNTFEGNWTDGQPGWGIVFTPRNQDGSAPFCTVSTVLFEKNIVVSERGVNLLGIDDVQPSGTMTGIIIRNNLFVLDSDFLQAGGEVGTLSVTGNDVLNRGALLKLYAGAVWPKGKAKREAAYAIASLTLRNNLVRERGIYGDGTAPGEAALERFTVKHEIVW